MYIYSSICLFFYRSPTGYLVICFAIEYAQTFPKLAVWISSDPRLAVDLDDGSEDEDVAREEDRVSHMDGVSGAAAGEEVVLRGLRKVFRTKQARLASRGDGETVHYNAGTDFHASSRLTIVY